MQSAFAAPAQTMGGMLPQIANEIAMDILPIEDIKKLYGYTDDAWGVLMRNPTFDAMLQDAIVTWQSAGNVEKRIRFKALASVEMSLLRFHTDMNNPEITLASRTEALKTIIKLAGMDKPEPVSGSVGSGWSLTINVGGASKEPITITPAGPPTIEVAPA
jgi:hypothetical protein